MRILQCKLTTIEAMLGTASNNKELHSEFIASHAPDAPSREEEIEAVGVEEVIEKGMTVFSRNKDGQPILWDYQIKGFFKDACGVLRKVKGTKSSKIKAYKKEIDGLIFVQERQIPVQTAEEMGSCQRPLRAQTAQGERNSLASSEEIAAGAKLEFSILVMSDDLVPAVKEWLSYGKLRGLGQWRNSAKRGHGKDLLGVTRHSKGIARKGNGQQRKGIDTLSLAWQCSARAEDREAMLRKGRGYIQRSRREGGAMGKEEICNMDCLHCVHPDCINERPMTRQARYYWRHRDRLLAEKREKYRRKKNELEGLPERKE